jgi:hypothetical protein
MPGAEHILIFRSDRSTRQAILARERQAWVGPVVRLRSKRLSGQADVLLYAEVIVNFYTELGPEVPANKQLMLISLIAS